MKSLTLVLGAPLICVVALIPPAAAQARTQNQESLKQEAAMAIRRGVGFLEKAQAPNGAMGDPEQPAITALAVLAILGDPGRDPDSLPPSAKKGFDFIASTAQPDGGLYVKGLANYNTSICLTALMAHPQGDLRPLARRARAFVAGLQQDNGEKDEADHTHDGGIGYGGSSQYSDLSNTHFALEALYYAQTLDAEQPPSENEPKLNYEAAIAFVSRCQNLKAHNSSAWVSEDPANKGGFVYEPGVSKAGEQDLGDGRKALRSSGSISYAGLLSLIYAKLSPDDDRVKAVLAWLQDNFSATENPGLGGQGLYYYYHSMAKALTALNLGQLQKSDGTQIDWRQKIGNQILNAQDPSGSWTNPAARWRESDTAYATALATLTLIHIHNSL
ncbi:MAG: prenyltransferase/squalene oxidase repeat-containing protein [Verrucomicrobiales bacterium]